jgi:hypothetical protein
MAATVVRVVEQHEQTDIFKLGAAEQTPSRRIVRR